MEYKHIRNFIRMHTTDNNCNSHKCKVFYVREQVFFIFFVNNRELIDYQKV